MMAPISTHMPVPVIAQYVFFVTIGIWYEISRRDIFRNVDAVILALQETVFGHPYGTDQSTGLKPSLQTETQGRTR